MSIITKEPIKEEHDEEKVDTTSTKQELKKEDLEIAVDVLSTAQVPHESQKDTPISCDSEKYDTLVRRLRTKSKNTANTKIDYMPVLRPTRTYSKLKTSTSLESMHRDETRDQKLGSDFVIKEKENPKPTNATEQTYSGSTMKPMYTYVYICEICSERFATRAMLMEHLNSTHTVETGRNYEAQCSICKKRFTSKAYVKIHLRIHRGEKPFKCHICDKKYTQRCSLNAHLISHREKKNLTCRNCMRLFSNFERFKSHQNNNNKKAVKCNLCEKEFPHKCLKFHRDVHGVRPYSCDFCAEKFKIKSTLYAHRQRKHIYP